MFRSILFYKDIYTRIYIYSLNFLSKVWIELPSKSFLWLNIYTKNDWEKGKINETPNLLNKFLLRFTK